MSGERLEHSRFLRRGEGPSRGHVEQGAQDRPSSLPCEWLQRAQVRRGQSGADGLRLASRAERRDDDLYACIEALRQPVGALGLGAELINRVNDQQEGTICRRRERRQLAIDSGDQLFLIRHDRRFRPPLGAGDGAPQIVEQGGE
jgi:hypothetical protein